MNRLQEREFARRVAQRLSASARELDDGTAARLRAARERALAAGGEGRRWPGALLPRAAALRTACAMLAVLLFSAAGEYWNTAARVSVQQELDTALLSDDLPIDAYLDTEFKAWLQRASQS